jgi:DNA-directed RNA polymerase specialized sigma24 family protein
MKRDQIFQEVLKNPIYSTIIAKYMTNKDDREEFTQFIWLILSEIPHEKIEAIWEKNQFLWYYCGIIKNQVISSNSKWHKEYRLPNQRLIDYEHYEQYNNYNEIIEDDSLNELEYIADLKEKKQKQNQIDMAIHEETKRNPLLITEFALFNMKYKDNLSYREIAAKTRIPTSSVFQYVKNAEILIKKQITYKKNNLR